ncbi:MAG: DeoR family transcriptional regulator, fructose operon transcriptional repressor [Clostridia bacterium]|jgi:DeoR family fructose operon transcriptional repressor|nr:DeoR/GlpR transcriptional regulator [Clostridiales bacterium]MDK2985025.1 DeoR family transcriptional regulator, fructose operon transcriptional repressor [Clostridia bacterium]
MFAEERRKQILKMLEKKNRIEVSDLSAAFNVSEVTVRRDLKELEKQGLILRTHGGAIQAGSRRFEPSFEEKADRYLQEKEKIGFRASQFINDGETVLIDTGTTTAHIITHLKDKNNLTLVTNGLNIMDKVKLLDTSFEVVLVGGVFKPKTQAFVGPLTENVLKDIRVDKAFIATNGFTLQDGATTPDLIEARIKKTMIEIAQEVYLIFDHSKFDKVTFSKFADLEDIDYIITDRITEDLRQKLSESGIEVIIAD